MVRSSSQVAARPVSPLRRSVAGVMLLVLATALSVHGLSVHGLSGAAAQEFEDGGDADGPPGDDGAGGVEGTTETFEVTDLALYASSLADVVPDTLRTGIPPAVVCVLATELCPEQLDPVREAASGVLDQVLDGVPPEPFHPVPPGTAAVSVLGGADRYQSAVRFEVPPLPEGEEFTAFEVRFDTSLPSFDVNSPAFRRVVLGAFSSLAEGNDPSFFFEGLQEGLVDEAVLDVDENALGVEACPFTAAFEPGGPPAAGSAEEDLPRDEESDEVEVDCLLGSSGVLDEETGEWVFDLTFAANAWGAGEIDNLGLLLSPTGVPNLAFGDEDVTTSGQINLDAEEVEITFASAEPPPPPPPLGDDLGDLEDLGELDDAGFDEGGVQDDLAFDDGFDDGAFESGPAMGGPNAVDGPPTADSAEAPMAADGTVGEGQRQVVTRPARGAPIDPWWLWLLIPLFGGGGYLVAAPLLAPTSAAGATATPGAMSRLLARSGSGLA